MLAARLIDQDQLHAGLRESHTTQEPLSVCLSRTGGVNTAELFDGLAQATGVPRHQVLQHRPEAQTTALVSSHWVQTNRAIPLCYTSEPAQLIVVITDPTRTGPIEHINEKSKTTVRAELASDDEFDLIFQNSYGRAQPPPLPPQPERIPTSAFVSKDPLQHSSMVVQNMDEMRNQLHRPTQQSTAGHRSATRGLSMRREDSPIPLPADALIPMPETSDWLSQVEISSQLSQAIEAVFELCIENGLFTREEYLARLNTEIDAR